MHAHPCPHQKWEILQYAKVSNARSFADYGYLRRVPWPYHQDSNSASLPWLCSQSLTYRIPTLTQLASSNTWSTWVRYMVKLKYVIKLVADICSKPDIMWLNFIWSNSNTWSNVSYGQIYKFCISPCIWATECPYMVKHAANIWSKFKKIPLHNSHGYDVSLS